MTQTIITAGDASAGLVQQGGNDGTLVLQTGAAGAKVNAVSYATDGTATLLKGPTIGTATTPVPSGSAPLYGCRAWCVFDGNLSGTNAPTSGGNVTSVTRNSTGNYTVTFTTAMPDANYSVVITSDRGGMSGIWSNTTIYAAASIQFICASASSGSTSFSPVDAKPISVAIFR